MKYYVVKANPKNFEVALSKVKDHLRLASDKEVTLVLAGGTYNVKETICFDKADFDGKCRLRIVAASNIRPTFTSLTRIPSESFKKAEGKPYYVYRFSEQERALFGRDPVISRS